MKIHLLFLISSCIAENTTTIGPEITTEKQTDNEEITTTAEKNTTTSGERETSAAAITSTTTSTTPVVTTGPSFSTESLEITTKAPAVAPRLTEEAKECWVIVN